MSRGRPCYDAAPQRTVPRLEAAPDSASPDKPPATHGRQGLLGLAIGAVGVVYGDIGTSPLYAIKESLGGSHGLQVNHDNVVGVLSLMAWALFTIVTLKYVLLIMRADNRGEGGIMALMALVRRSFDGDPRLRAFLLTLGMFGAALFYGDAMITPAISVLSAVEGLEVVTPVLKPYVLPVTLLVITGLFFVQQTGTARVGAFFGPVMTVWFTVLGTLGLISIVHYPSVLEALNPYWGVKFFTNNGTLGFLVLGSVVLAVTGAEALYADMGHFGKRPIKLAWLWLVFPALLLNYFGQGALLLRDPAAVQHPFFLLAPAWALLPMVVLATLATVIASQAVISGAYSITRQAIQLGYCPRLMIEHTSEREIGQVYLPWINWGLYLAVVGLVLGFGSSSNLAGAYGIAVTATMAIDSVLIFFVMRKLWNWPLAFALPVSAAFLIIDLSFFSANVLKIVSGGWFPVVVGIIVFAVLSTWKRGREILFERLRPGAIALEPFIRSLAVHPPARVPGTAVFLTASQEGVPHALLHNLNHNKVLHERVVFLTVEIRDVPWVNFEERVTCERMGHGCWRVRVRFGFMNRPDVMRALEVCGALGLEFDMMQTSFFLSRQQVVPGAGGPSKMPRWRERMFSAMARNAGNVTDYFGIPTNRVIELGTRVEI